MLFVLPLLLVVYAKRHFLGVGRGPPPDRMPVAAAEAKVPGHDRHPRHRHRGRPCRRASCCPGCYPPPVRPR
jgi:hypothetical protein